MKRKADLRRRFLALDDKLHSKGVPPMTGWWRSGVGDWLTRYEQEHCLELDCCVGRGAGKSAALYKLALFFTLEGDFHIPPGEIHYAVVLSRLKTEAEKGVAIISRWLALLNIQAQTTTDTIELVGERRGIRVVAASVAATSGWRAFFVAKDEKSKWKESGLEEEDAAEVDTSANSMTATHRDAPSIDAGSAWTKGSIFHKTITEGSTAFRHVLGPTPTWIAAPHISEADCRAKERNLRRFLREYASVFANAVNSAFNEDHVQRGFDARIPSGFLPCGEVMLIDPTAGGSDAWAWATAGWHVSPDGERRVLALGSMDGIAGAAKAGITSDAIVGRVVGVARARGATVVHSDQFERYTLASTFTRYGLRFVPHVWTAPLKERAVEHVRAWLADGVLVLPAHSQFQRELHSFDEKIASSGAATFQGRRGGADDFCMLLLLAALTDIEKGLPGSPLLQHATASPPAQEHSIVETHGGFDSQTFGSVEAIIDGLSVGILT